GVRRVADVKSDEGIAGVCYRIQQIADDLKAARTAVSLAVISRGHHPWRRLIPDVDDLQGCTGKTAADIGIVAVDDRCKGTISRSHAADNRRRLRVAHIADVQRALRAMRNIGIAVGHDDLPQSVSSLPLPADGNR